MKKLVFSVVVTVAVILAAILYLTHRAPHASRVAGWVPGDSLAFFHVPDVPRSRERWTKTALYQIAHEPEVVAFLERPKSKIPQRDEIHQRVAQIDRIDPREAFLAVTSIPENNVPKFVAGFSYHGPKSEVDALLGDIRKSVQSAWPAGKFDLAKAGANEIETFKNGSVTFALAYKEDWLVLADDVTLLGSTLDRFDGKSENPLRDNANFRAAVSHMPIDFDVLSFVQMQAIANRLASFLMMMNPGADPHQLDELKKIQAFAGAMKIEGENIRDTMCVLKPDEAKKEPMRRNSLSLTSTNTLLYYAVSPPKPANVQMPNPAAMEALGVNQFLQPFASAFAEQGLTLDEFWSAFGPEFSFVTDWPAAAQIPAPILAIDVRDAAKAQRFVDAITQAKGPLVWAKTVSDGTQYYQLPAAGFGMIQAAPTLAMADKFVLIGITFDSVKSALARLKSGDGKIDGAAVYRAAAGNVHEPTTAFGFVDARSLFERIYGPLRPFAMMWAAFVKGSGDYVDVGKLPATETISKHLGPIVYSQSSFENGAVSESVGPVTMTQALFGFGLGAGAALVPYFKQQFSSPPVPPSAGTSSGGIFGGGPAVPSATVSPSPQDTP